MQIILTEEEYNKLKTPNEDWVSRARLFPALNALADKISAIVTQYSLREHPDHDVVAKEIRTVWAKFQDALKP